MYNIVIYTNSFAGGGLEKVAADTSVALTEIGCDVKIICQESRAVVFKYAGEVFMEDCRSPQVLSALSNADYIIDYTWRGGAASPLLKHVFEQHSEKLIPTVHNTTTVWQYLRMYQQYKVLDAVPSILCVSDAVKKAVRDKFGANLPAVRIYNPFMPGALERIEPVVRDKPYFVWVGRVDAVEHKGIDILVDAWAESGLGDRYDLVLVGGKSLPDTVQGRIAELGVENSVVHNPFTADVYSWILGAECLVLPSRWEGFGLVLLEALQCGVPCIATRCGGPEEIIKQEYNGLMVDVGDVSGFARAMVRMATDRALHDRLAGNAGGVLDSFSYAVFKENWKRLLRNLDAEKEKRPSMKRPAVSVHLPVYNKGKYLRECLDSVLAQDFQDFEIIAVDDASTDDSYEILNEYASKHENIKVFQNTRNLGTLHTRKRCLEEAQGEYMVFVDADDMAEPHMIRELYRTAVAAGADFVQCAADIYNPENTITSELEQRYRKHFSSIKPFTATGRDVLHSLAYPIRTNFWISMVKKHVYKSIIPHVPDTRVQHGNDGLMIYLMTYFAKKYTTLNKILYKYRANSSSSNLIIPSPETACAHIKSRALIIECIKDFMDRVEPAWDMEEQPFPRFSEKEFNYSVHLMERSLGKHPESRAKLYQCLSEAFGDKAMLYIGKQRKKEEQGGAAEESTVAQNKPTIRRLLDIEVLHRIYEKSPGFVQKFLSAVKYGAILPAFGFVPLLKQFLTIRRSGLFFPEYYLASNPDVRDAGLNPLWHFIRNGSREGRLPNPLFQPRWYLANHSDVRKANVEPLLHYVRSGWKEGRETSPDFSIKAYLKQRDDVREAGVNPLKHYLQHGLMEKEARKPQAEMPALKSNLRSKWTAPAKGVSGLATSASGNDVVALNETVYKISTNAELVEWFFKHSDFMQVREKMQGFSERDYMNANLKLIQDLAICDFAKKHLPDGARILEIGGGRSRILTFFKDRFRMLESRQV